MGNSRETLVKHYGNEAREDELKAAADALLNAAEEIVPFQETPLGDYGGAREVSVEKDDFARHTPEANYDVQ